MSEVFQVHVEGVRFAAAHFATFGGSCEPLHGHSYEVAARVEGQLSEKESWVIDFTEVKSLLRSICRELDHRFLLQCDSRQLAIRDEGGAFRIATPAGQDYVLPKTDVAALPIDNSTAERLAQWLAGRLCEALAGRGATGLSMIEVEVWEGPGQSASYRKVTLPVK